MPDLLLALFAGILTIAAPCTLPVLPILLGASIGRRAGARPAFIAAGFVASFRYFVALAVECHRDSLTLRPGRLAHRGPCAARHLRRANDLADAIRTAYGPSGGGWRRMAAHHGSPNQFRRLRARHNARADLDALRGAGAGSNPTAVATSPDHAHGALLLLTYTVGAAVPMLAVAYGGQAISTRVRSVAPYTVRLQQAFGIIVIAFALSAFLQYDAIALGWLGQFFPEGRIGL